MQNSPITIADIATVASVAAIIFGGIFQGIKLLIEYLTAKFSPASQAAASEHRHESRVESLIETQNRHMERMLEQNGKQIDALANVSHQAELRHQIVLAKLDRIETLQSR